MTDLTPRMRELLQVQQKRKPEEEQVERDGVKTERTEKTVDEFLREAYRINSHIQSLLTYLHSIRQSYLSTTSTTSKQSRAHKPSLSISTLNNNITLNSTDILPPSSKSLTDTDRDAIDSSTALLLRDLSSSISNLHSAEALRQDTQAQLLRRKFGVPGGRLFKWASGGEKDFSARNKSAEQIAEESAANSLAAVRDSVLWFLRRRLEYAAEVQRGMVEKRIERVREKEKSVLYKARHQQQQQQNQPQEDFVTSLSEDRSFLMNEKPAYDTSASATLSAADAAAIESQLTPAQLQLFAEENQDMLKQYEDALSKVQNAEKSLLEISSLQQTLVSHLATQEEYIGQLVADAATTSQNVDRGNKELRRASERRSTAQMVFWGTVGLCTWLVVWDAVF